MDTAIKEKLGDSTERCFSLLLRCCFELKPGQHYRNFLCKMSVVLVQSLMGGGSYSQSCHCMRHYCMLRASQKKVGNCAGQNTVILPVTTSSFTEVMVWWAVLRNRCGSSRNELEALCIKHRDPWEGGKLEGKPLRKIRQSQAVGLASNKSNYPQLLLHPLSSAGFSVFPFHGDLYSSKRELAEGCRWQDFRSDAPCWSCRHHRASELKSGFSDLLMNFL